MAAGHEAQGQRRHGPQSATSGGRVPTATGCWEWTHTAGTIRWRARLADWARANLDVFRRHPWVLPLVTSSRPMGPQECAWGETALQVIADAGFAPPADGLVLQLVNGYGRGAAVPVAERAPDPAVIERSGRAEELPRMLALLTAPSQGPADGDDGFEFGLARLLDGVEAYRARR